MHSHDPNAPVLLDKAELSSRMLFNRVGIWTSMYYVRASEIDLYQDFCPNYIALENEQEYYEYKLLSKSILRGRLQEAVYLKVDRDFMDFNELHIRFD